MENGMNIPIKGLHYLLHTPCCCVHGYSAQHCLHMQPSVVIQEQYKELYAKTQSFWSIVTCQYDAEWIVKVDDDIYIGLEKVPALLQQWDRKGVGEPSKAAHPQASIAMECIGANADSGPWYRVHGSVKFLLVSGQKIVLWPAAWLGSEKQNDRSKQCMSVCGA